MKSNIDMNVLVSCEEKLSLQELWAVSLCAKLIYGYKQSNLIMLTAV
jgi:hypothetical protein